MSNTDSSLPKDLLRLCEQQQPHIFLVLGSGYGALAEKIKEQKIADPFLHILAL